MDMILGEPIKVKRDRASLGKAFFLLKSMVTQKQLYTLLDMEEHDFT